MDTGSRFSIAMRNEEQDFFRILWWNRKQKWWSLTATMVLPSLIFVTFAWFSKPVNPENDKTWVLYSCAIGMPFFIALLTYLTLRKQARQLAADAESVVVGFDDDGVDIDSIKGSSSTKWSAFANIAELPEDFVFYPQPNIFFGVPKRYFSNPEQIDVVRKLISQVQQP